MTSGSQSEKRALRSISIVVHFNGGATANTRFSRSTRQRCSCLVVDQARCRG